MFIGLYEFNARKLNIQPFYRLTKSGKRILVKSHKRQAILRAKEALKELAKSKTEAGYIMTKSGKLSKKISQNNPKQIKWEVKGKSLRSNSAISAKLHNHPLTGKNKSISFVPSPADIRNSITTGQRGFVISSNEGSIYRYSLGNKLKRLPSSSPERKALISSLSDIEQKLKGDTTLSGKEKLVVLDRLYERLNKEQLIRYKPEQTDLVKKSKEKLKTKADAWLAKV